MEMLNITHEDQLVNAAVAGDALALQRLLLVHWPQLDTYVQHHLPQPLRDFLEPRDILQDVSQLAFRSITTFKPQGEGSIYRWLVTIARNRMAEVLRAQSNTKRGGKLRQELGDVDDASVALMLEQLAISHRTPSMSAVRHELADALESSLKLLPTDYQQALRLRYLQGNSVEQVAGVMNRSAGSVLMLCNRGLKQLRLHLVSASRYS